MTKIEGVSICNNPKYGTSFCGYLTASYASLVALLDEPIALGRGDGKVSTEWDLNWCGDEFTIYDYKMTSLYDEEYESVEEFRKRDVYDWHIGGHSNSKAKEFIAVLEKALAGAAK